MTEGNGPALAYDARNGLLKVDLHGCSTMDAQVHVPVILQQARLSDVRGVLFIYGKSNNDLATATHAAIKSWDAGNEALSLCFSGGKYQATVNGSPFDCAVLVLMQGTGKRFPTIAGFRRHYGNTVEGIGPANQVNCEVLLAPELRTCLEPPTNSSIKPKVKAAIAKSPSKNKVVFPAEWLEHQKRKQK